MNHPQTTFTPLTKVILGVFVVLLVTGPLYFAAAQSTRLDNGGNQLINDTSSDPLEPFGGAGPTITPNVNGTGGVITDPTNSSISREVEAGGPDARSENPDQQPVDDVFADAPVKKFLYSIVVNLFGWLVFAGGYLLDFAVTNFVINFGLEFNTSGVGQAVNELWSVVRDFFNILFIFGFIYIGFQMILDSGNTAARKTLASLIAAALLVNFSLFISKFVVDFSNRIASEIAVAGFPKIDADNTYFQIESANQVSISDTYFAHLGITRTLQVPQQVQQKENEPWAFIFGSAIFYLVAAFVFAAGGIMLIIRFVALSIFMVLSPFMFLGWIFPNMQSWTNKYWTNFLGRAFYAPVYILLLFFAGSILQKMFGPGGSGEIRVNGETTGGGLLSAVTNNEDNLIQILGPFVLTSAFMIAAVQVAGKMSADGAGGVMKVGGNLVRGAQNRAKSVGRFGVRNTAGAATSYIANPLAEKAQSRINRASASLAQGNKLSRWTARRLDNNVGAALGAAATATVAGSETAKQRRERLASQQVRFNNTASTRERANDFNENLNLLSSGQPLTKSERKDAQKKLAKAIKKMDKDELLSTIGIKNLQNENVAQHLSSAQQKALAESGAITNATIKTIGKNREAGMFKDLQNVLLSSTATSKDLEEAMEELTKKIGSMSNEEVSNISYDRLSTQAIAAALSEKQIDAIRDSGNVTATELDNIKKAKESALIMIARSGRVEGEEKDSDGKITKRYAMMPTDKDTDQVVAKQRKNLIKGKAVDVAKMPPEVFKVPSMAQYITPAALGKRAEDLDLRDKNDIEAVLNSYINDPATDAKIPNMWDKWSRTAAGVRFDFS